MWECGSVLQEGRNGAERAWLISKMSIEKWRTNDKNAIFQENTFPVMAEMIINKARHYNLAVIDPHSINYEQKMRQNTVRKQKQWLCPERKQFQNAM